MYKTVVVGLDSSPTAEEAARQAIALAKLVSAKLHLVSAYKPQALSSSSHPELAKSMDTGDLAESVLETFASQAKVAGVDAEVHAEIGDPAEAICRVAGEVSADLIVVGNKGMKGARRVLGSVPNSVAHAAPCSVLIVATDS